ncbi:hypothetical protein TSUD_39070 [Trifolium subterraneum]|uniref:Uncharacterized protein n=1 Tax=Trifolium subterraneum TaxID=3900 RepID=A0A2Z6MLR0_TRISU|nr:hypothetical protein TSUD_39070 [Trifolium subterraneum]
MMIPMKTGGWRRTSPREDLKALCMTMRTHERRRYTDRSSPSGRGPGYDQERHYADHKRSPGRPPIINDWLREDRFEDEQNLKIIEYPMEVIRWKANLLSEPKT